MYRLVPLIFLFSYTSLFGQNPEPIPDTLNSINIDLLEKHLDQKKGVNYSGVYNSHIRNDDVYTLESITKNNTTDATRIMQSKSAGLSIFANSYSPGASSKILLRGFRSINGNNQPLILLNGMPIDNSEWNNSLGHTDQSNRLIDIDPNIIQSIDVISNMAGRAKYGIDGGNGIIQIKTKRGNKSKPRIYFKTSIGIDQVSNLPSLQNTYAQGRTTSLGSIYRGPETRESFSWGPKVSDLIYNGDPNYPYDNNGSLIFNSGTNGSPANIYNPYRFFENGAHSNISLQVDGGSNKIDYFFAVSSNNQQGIIPTTHYKRYNLFSAINFYATDKLTLQINALFSKSDAQRNMTGANLQGIMLGLLRTSTTFDNANGLDDAINNPSAYSLINGIQRSSTSGRYNNPYWSLNNNKHEDDVNRQIFKLSGQYKLNDKIELLFGAGSDNFSDRRVGGSDINPGFSTGLAYDRQINYNAQSLDLSSKYTFKKGNALNISSTIGINYNQEKSTYLTTEGSRFITTSNISIDNLEIVESSQTVNQNSRSGGLLSLDVGFKDYLNITGSVRQDYSNKFGSETNGFLSYGLGASLSITDLIPSTDPMYIKPFDFLLFASIGKFGNDYGRNNRYAKYTSSTINGDDFIQPTDLEDFEINNITQDNRLTSERINAYDVGINLSFLKCNLGFQVDYYNETSNGLIIIDRLAASSGFEFSEKNIGSISNKGFNISFDIEPIKKEKISWSLSLGFNKNKNEVTNIGEFNDDIFIGGFNTAKSSALINHPYGSIIGLGFMRNEADLLVIGNHGFPLVDPEPKVVANPNPDWTMYINNTLNIGKKFSLNAIVDIKQGGDMYCGTCGSLDYLGKTQRSADERGVTAVFEGVTETGSPNTQSVELASFSEDDNNYYRVRYGFGGITEMNIYDASWIRLRNVSIQYNMTDVVKLKAIENLSVTLFAENLFLISEYPSIDPETNLTGNSGGIGFEYYNNPGTKRYGITINASF